MGAVWPSILARMELRAVFASYMVFNSVGIAAAAVDFCSKSV